MVLRPPDIRRFFEQAAYPYPMPKLPLSYASAENRLMYVKIHNSLKANSRMPAEELAPG
jgi:hypothetical protein